MQMEISKPILGPGHFEEGESSSSSSSSTTTLTSRASAATTRTTRQDKGLENSIHENDDDYLQFKYNHRRREKGRIHLARFLVSLRGWSRHPLAGSIRASLWCCLGFWIVVGFIAFAVITQGHRVTCSINTAFCTPFVEYLRLFTTLPDPAAVATPLDASVRDAGSSCERFEPYASMLQGPNGKKKDRHENLHSHRLLFLIGESRAGSTFAYDTLNLHPSITMKGNEPLYEYANEACNNNKMLRSSAKPCTFEGWLEALYTNSFLKRKPFFDPLTNWGDISSDDIKPGQPPRQFVDYLGTKINIEQIPTEFYRDLADFLECLGETAVVVHVTRAATIASFFNYQLEVPERLQGANPLDFSSQTAPKALERPVAVDPELAAGWVRRREALSGTLGRLLEFATPGTRYLHLHYEQLQGTRYADDRWNAVWGFLGVDRLSVDAAWEEKRNNANKKKRNRTVAKVHGGVPCHQRISNWQEVRTALLRATGSGSTGDDSLESLSVLACENESS